MTKVFNLERLLTKKATKTARYHSVAREWFFVIVTLLVLKLALSGVSMFAGYNYLLVASNQLIDVTWIATAAAALFLLLLEVLTWNFLSKFWKFALRGQKGTAAGLFVFVVGLFAVSFYTSTNGIASYTSAKVDNSAEIRSKYNARIESTKADYNQTIDALRSQINTIKNNPAGWVNGSREVLTSKQQTQLAEANNRIMKLKQERANAVNKIQAEQKADLEANQANQTNEAAKYWNIVAILLGVMFLAHGGLMYFWVKIYREAETQAAELEEAQSTAADIAANVRDLSKAALQAQQTAYMQAVEHALQREKNTLHIQTPVPEKTEAPAAELEPVKIDQDWRQYLANQKSQKIGFSIGGNSTQTSDASETPGTDTNQATNYPKNGNGNGNAPGENISNAPGKNTNDLPTSFNEFKRLYKHAKTDYLQKHSKVTEQLLQRRASPHNRPTLAKIGRATRRSYSTVQSVNRVLNEVIQAGGGHE